MFVAATNFPVLNFAFCNLLDCNPDNIFVVNFQVYLFFIAGIVAPLTRIVEGYNYQVLKTKFLRFFFSGYKDLKVPEDVQPLSLFLASSFNVEIVYVILKGITQFAYVDLAHTDEYRRDTNPDEINESSRTSI